MDLRYLAKKHYNKCFWLFHLMMRTAALQRPFRGYKTTFALNLDWIDSAKFQMTEGTMFACPNFLAKTNLKACVSGERKYWVRPRKIDR